MLQDTIWNQNVMSCNCVTFNVIQFNIREGYIMPQINDAKPDLM